MTAHGQAGRSNLALLLGMVVVVACIGGVVTFVLRQGAKTGADRAPALSLVTPARSSPGEIIMLRGTRFASSPQGNEVLIGGRRARVVRATSHELSVEVPPLDVSTTDQRAAVLVRVGERVSNVLAVDVAAGEQTEPPQDAALESEPLAGAEPAADPADVPARPKRTRRSKPRPSPAAADKKAAPASRRTGPAEGLLRRAAAESDPAASAKLYRRALEADPNNDQAKKGLARARTALAGSKRRFAAGKTTVEGRKKKKSSALAGFDAAGVDVKQPPSVPARIEFDVSPDPVRPGDKHVVRIYLHNYGKKKIKVKGIEVDAVTNEQRAAVGSKLQSKQAAPNERALLNVVSTEWKSETRSWRMEVRVTTHKGDHFRSQLFWK